MSLLSSSCNVLVEMSPPLKCEGRNRRTSPDSTKEIFQRADNIHASNTPSASVASVRVAAASAQLLSSLDETLAAIPYANPEVAAVARGGRARGRGGRSRGGRGRGSQQPNQSGGGQSRHRGPKHPDLPPGEWSGCSLHYRWGKRAHFCSEPATCPWKNIFTPKPQK